MVDGLETFYRSVVPSTKETGTPPLVLVHGFGISSEHFVKNMQAIADATGAPVYAIDLIGFGRSEKPSQAVYGIELWARQLEVFLDALLPSQKVFLAGNSIGGYVCMTVAADRPSACAGLGLINSAGAWGALNPFGVPVPFLQWPPLARGLGRVLFDVAREPRHVQRTLQRVYADPTQVDGALVSAILGPASTAEALAAGPHLFASLFLLPPGRSWKHLLSGAEGYKGPVLAVWGAQDPWLLPRYVRLLQEFRGDVEVAWVDAGHCPHHERPREVNSRVAEWMQRTAAAP